MAKRNRSQFRIQERTAKKRKHEDSLLEGNVFQNAPEDMDENIRKALDAQNENMNLETVGYAPWGFFPAKTTTFLDDNLDKVFYDKMDLDTFIDKANETIAEDFADGYVFAG